MKAFSIVRQFEDAVAAFAGSRYAVAVNTCTSALFLSMVYEREKRGSKTLTIPAKTFISVPMAALQAGHQVKFDPSSWRGVYNLKPLEITDGALRFRKGMYAGGLHCISFHARKLLNIGEGGMVLTDDPVAAAWLRKASYSGRGAPTYAVQDIDMLGWQMYMTPEKAARGLHLMEYVSDDLPDQMIDYVDLRTVKFFQKQAVAA